MTTTQQIEQRLRIGEQMINAEPDPRRQIELEDYWLQLLAEYEAAADAKRDHELPPEGDQ